MKRNKRNHKNNRWIAIVLVCAIMSGSIPSALTQSVYAAAEEKKNHTGQNIWYEVS